MLAFFPQVYEDELLFGILGRYHRMTGNMSFKATLSDLFGINTVCAVADLPSHLQRLSDRIPGNVYNPSIFIEKHTLFPYYSPFLPIERAILIRKSMVGDEGEKLHMQTGIMASTISTPPYLRYCPDCVFEELNRVGVPYWHRIHQISGVFLCPIHESPLHNSSVPYTLRNNRQQFKCITDVDFVRAEPVIAFNSWDLPNLLYIARQSQWLLDNPVNSSSLDCFRQFYIDRLRERTLVVGNGKLCFKEIVDSFTGFYGSDFLDKMQSRVNEADQDTWLHKVLRKPRVSCHPLRHILLMGYFDEPISGLFNKSKKSNKGPFGIGPWPCLNKAAEHYRQNVVAICEIKYGKENHLPIGTFECKCGYVYTRTGPDQNQEDVFKGRLKTPGQVWIDSLYQISEQKLPLREMSRRLGVDTNTVKRYLSLKETQLKANDLKSAADNNVFDKTAIKRNTWTKHMEQHPLYSRTELRSALPSLYIWLYRNDKEWLMNILPGSNKSVPNNKRVNWEKRDEELSIIIADVIRSLMGAEPPIRISKSIIGQETRKLAWLDKHIDKLPKCKAIIDTYSETVEEFRIRRIRFTAERLRKEDNYVPEWRIIREAGLPSDLDPMLHEIIAQESSSFYTGQHIQ